MKRRRKRKGGHYHTGTHTSPKAGDCRYRSGWELSYMKYLDDLDDVVLFSYESLAIPYVSNKKTGKLRKYYPDFVVEYVDGTSRLVEIKPKKRLDQVKVKKKLDAAREWCKTHGVIFEVITEVELSALGILK